VYPAPAGEKPSEDFAVKVNGLPVFIDTVATLHGGSASFGGFDFAGQITVTIASTRPVTSAKVLPASYGITPAVSNAQITFKLARSANLTVEINGSIDRALHLFANPLELGAPKQHDPNVIYFGAGIHDLGPTQLKNNQTVYLAGGAIVRPTIPPDEKPTVEKDWSGCKCYRPLLEGNGVTNLTIRGRGVLDLSQLPWHARTAIVLHRCDGALVEGITLLDAPCWGVASFGSRHLTVRNVKEICRRSNSDGIDICNSQDVLVTDCFLRNNDDEACVKTTSPAPALESQNIVVSNCVVWNERARGLGITSETRRNIAHVLFRDCDIIHDFSEGGCAALAILVSDSGTMSDIRFEDIRVEQVNHTLVSCWIGADMWGHDHERGRINGARFKNITVAGGNFPVSTFTGCDSTHLIENVTFENLRINGKLITDLAGGKISTNLFIRSLRVISNDNPQPIIQ
jgi:polygalacturonase